MPLTGGSPTRRLKLYTAESGYVFQYVYEGHRPTREGAVEHVFNVSGDRKTYFPVSVLLPPEAYRTWQVKQGRELSSTELYAIVKMALFQAFDTRQNPAAVASAPVHVTAGDVARILETLGID
ncbi:MAG: hypothetical protein ACKV22_04195 [Bryobacteraceae bacterium]